MVRPRSESPNFVLTLRYLEEQDLTPYLLATKLGINVRNARAYLKLAKDQGKAHVVEWCKHGQFGNGPPVPKWAAGKGVDAVRPQPMTGTESMRKQRSNPLRRVERKLR